MGEIDVFADACRYDEARPEGYRCGELAAGAAAGGRDLAVRVYELPPGQSVCPYHYEYEEEWLVVLDGAVVLRTPTGEQTIERGAVVRFEPGPRGAHKATNRSDRDARVMMFSSAREPAVAVYPDSDKIGVWPGDDRDKAMLRRADGGVDYWEGER